MKIIFKSFEFRKSFSDVKNFAIQYLFFNNSGTLILEQLKIYKKL